MQTQAEQSKLRDKLMGPVSKIIHRHKADIMPMLLGKSTSLTQAALKNDGAVMSVANFCYSRLPGLLRLFIKEERFLNFVMSNREVILGKLTAGEGTPGKDAASEMPPAK
jgi:hypothetical protein